MGIAQWDCAHTISSLITMRFMPTVRDTIEHRDNAVRSSVLEQTHGTAPRTLFLIKPVIEKHSAPFMQRELNVVLAAIGLILALPVMLVVAILVKLTSPGPILYKQVRVGVDRRGGAGGGNWRRKIDYGGRLFTMYKFRTMYVQSGPQKEVWAQKGDPRITPIGRILRSYRIDELPQLVNVLLGDMNIVGPRPEQPKIFAKLREQIDGYAERQRILPGITGSAQIRQHYDRDIDDVRQKLQHDLAYLKRQSVLEDVRTLLLTIPVVVFKRGAW